MERQNWAWNIRSRLHRSRKTERRIIRTKKATRDAKKLYKKTYGKNNDGIGEQDFIEDYLVENGLKQKALPEPESNKKHNFMDKYPTEKSEEEKTYEQENKRKIMYYEIEGKKYELPFIFSNEYLEKAKDDDKTLSTEDGTNYTINIKEMTPEDRNITLKRMIELSLNQIGQEVYMTAEINSNTPLKQSFPELTRKASYNDYIVKKLYTEGKVEEANTRLEKMVEKILQFYK